MSAPAQAWRSETLRRSERRWESAALAAMLASTVLLRVFYVFRYRVDSDEPQHLHVAWAWAHGLLQYRDVFDNHAPLFHIVCAPLVALIGERADIVVWMRLAMFPLYALGLWSVYALGVALYSRRVGIWSAALAALFPSYFLTALEVRADDLWTVLWLLALVALVGGSASVRRSAALGALLGGAVATSLKSVLLLAALAAAAPLARALTMSDERSPRGGALVPRLVAAAVALLAIPSLIVWYFAARGALEPLLYGTIVHNALPGLGEWHDSPLRPLLLAPVLLAVWWSARAVVDGCATRALAERRALIVVAAGLVVGVLVSIWPIVTPEDFLPVAPLVPLFLAGTLLMRPPPARRAWRFTAETALLCFAGLELIIVLAVGAPWDAAVDAETALLADVLKLTRAHDYVMDLKGETIFRRRPFYYALEAVTKARFRRGLLADSIPERLIATHTPVAVQSLRGMPPRARAFIDANYISVGRLRVVGRLLGSTGSTGPTRLVFEVAIPARYALVADDADCAGSLDGTPYRGPRYLAAGRHEFETTAGDERLALVWAPALRRGFSPLRTPRACH